MEYDNKFYETLSQRCRPWQEYIGASIIKHYTFRSAIDLGCGSGYYLHGMFKEGARVKGYEYSFEACKLYIPPSILAYISYADLGEKLNEDKYDFAMSIEVAEHLAENKSDIFMDNLCSLSDTILFSASSRDDKKCQGWGNKGEGWGHLNPQPKQYWIDKFTNRRYCYSESDVTVIRDMFSKCRGSRSYRTYLRNNIMFFRRNNE